MPLHEIVDTWQMWSKVITELEPHTGDLSQWRNRKWIPIATTGSDTYLFVVAAPGPTFGWLARVSGLCVWKLV